MKYFFKTVALEPQMMVVPEIKDSKQSKFSIGLFPVTEGHPCGR